MVGWYLKVGTEEREERKGDEWEGVGEGKRRGEEEGEGGMRGWEGTKLRGKFIPPTEIQQLTHWSSDINYTYVHP